MTKLLTLDDIREKLQDRNLREVSKRSDVGYATLYRIRNDAKYKCSLTTLEKLSDYLGE